MKIKIDRNELFKWAGYLGAALLIGGYLRYFVMETMVPFNRAALIVGAVLLVASLIANYRAIARFGGRRSTRLGANTVILTFGVIAIIAIVNFLGFRHHRRIDVTTEQLYSVSDQTRKIVGGLTKDVKVIKFAQSDDQHLHDLMKEYRDLSNHISYELIDPEAKPDIARQYKVSQSGETVVAAGDRTEKPSAADEEALTSAIIKVTRDSIKKVYFVEGHGEKRLSDSSSREGYGAFVARWLKDENYDSKTVNLVQSNQVPADCDVLVLAGPKQSLFPEEAASIGKYLDGGGKAMLLIDPDTDPRLDDVLKQWGLELGKNTVLDVSGAGRMFGMGPAVPVGLNYGTHSITKGFENYMTFFPLARSVEEVHDAGSNASTTDLVKTSEQSWAATDIKGDQVKFDPSRGDKKGPITVAVAATKPVADKEARLVVVGDSDFASNGFAQGQRNGDLFMNSVNWLAEEESLISIRPKSPTSRRVEMSASQQNMFLLLTIFLMPGAALGSGIVIWWKRR